MSNEVTTLSTLSKILLADRDARWIGDFYVAFHRCNYSETLTIIDGRNAFKNKSVCPLYRISGEECKNGNDSCPVLNSDWMHYPLETVVELLETADWTQWLNYKGSYNNIEVDGLTLYRSDENAKRTFNVNALDRLKPLTKQPKKWTLPMVVRALVNGQVSAYRKYKYTDDYAYDAASNYGEGAASNLWLAERLVDSPDGWWAAPDGDKAITCACHHFESFCLTFTDDKLAA